MSENSNKPAISVDAYGSFSYMAMIMIVMTRVMVRVREIVWRVYYRAGPTFTPGVFVKLHSCIKLIVVTLMSGGRVNRWSGGSRRGIQRIFRKINYDEN